MIFKTLNGRIWSAMAVVGGGIASAVAVVSQAVPHVLGVAVDQMAGIAFYPQRTEDPRQWKWFPLKREELEVAAEDGTILRGYFLPTKKNSVGTIVILHGHMSCADHVAWFAQEAVKAGFHAVVYDARAHGRSGGSICSFGLHEAEDARQVARHVAQIYPGPVFLWGISMGAAVGAQALAADTPFSGGVLFSPFSNLDAMVSATLDQRGLWWVPRLKNEIRGRIREIIGVKPSEVSPEKAAARIRVPVLIVHGRKDDRIPVAQGRAVFEAIPDNRKEYLELPEAGHDDLIEGKKPWGPATLHRVFDFLKVSR